jgi:glycosyltransferase involved in cell wall biosynthesis
VIYWRERPDLVHHVGLKPALYGGLAASLTGVRWRINALGGLGYIFMTSTLHIRAIRAVLRYTLRHLLRHPGTWLILQNRDDSALFISHRIANNGRTVLIRGSGVDIEAFQLSPEPPAPMVAVQVSRMLIDKGIRDLVEAARLLQQRGSKVRVQLVGQVDHHNPSAIPEHELHGWMAEGVIEWAGFRADIATLWRTAHIAILASYREGLPKSLLEAAASGRPIIATDVPGTGRS